MLCPMSGKPVVATTRDEAKEIGVSNQQAIHRDIRRLKHPEMHIGLTDDLMSMSAIQPTAELKARFESVFDREQRESLKIVLHPLLKRWTLFERVKHKGQLLWRTVCMFSGDKVDGYLPPDLQRSDKMLHHLIGEIGDFRNVNYQDLEFVEQCDFKKYGWEGVLAFISKFEDDEIKEKERVMDDFTDDFLDYSFWLAMRDAQDHYSRPWSTAPIDVKTAPDRWKIEQRNGYRVRTRIYGEEGDLNEMKALVAGELADYWTTASGRAASKILELKNKNYYKKHGVSLWEEVTGKKPGESLLAAAEGDSIAVDAENKTQVSELLELTQGSEPVEGVTVEQWIADLAKEKVFV